MSCWPSVMPRRLTIPLSGALLASVVVLAGTVDGRAASRCYAEWSEAAPIVAREKLRSARDVHDMAREELGGEVVRIVLCDRAEEGFVYRLVLRRLDGRIGTLTVTATRETSR